MSVCTCVYRRGCEKQGVSRFLRALSRAQGFSFGALMIEVKANYGFM